MVERIKAVITIQKRGKQVSAATNQHAKIDKLLKGRSI
jgi:hypothetical protein